MIVQKTNFFIIIGYLIYQDFFNVFFENVLLLPLDVVRHVLKSLAHLSSYQNWKIPKERKIYQIGKINQN